MIGMIVCMRDMSMKQKIDKNSNEASKEVQKEKSLDTTSEEQQRLKLEEETKAIHKQAELLLEDEKTRKKTPQEKIELSNKKLADNSAEFNKDKSMQNNTNANSKEQNFTSSQGNDSQIKALKFKVNALATILVLTIIGGAYGAYQFDKHKYDDLEIITNALKATEQNVLNTQNKINSV